MGVGPYIPNVYVGIMKYVYNGVTYYFIDNLDYFGAMEPYSDTRTETWKVLFVSRPYPLVACRLRI